MVVLDAFEDAKMINVNLKLKAMFWLSYCVNTNFYGRSYLGDVLTEPLSLICISDLGALIYLSSVHLGMFTS